MMTNQIAYLFSWPPLTLQEKFAERIKANEAQKKQVEATIAEMQSLLDSCMDYVARYQLYLPKKEELQAQLDKILNETSEE